ncbi:sphinganine C4-monooxygenase, partial [Tremellales sp. Uapishka_1]
MSTMYSSMEMLQQSHNSSLSSIIKPTVLNPPFYHTSSPNLLAFISDKHLSLLAPILVYWLLSFTFHYLDNAQIPYFEARRIHESPETLARNKATVLQVVKAVIFQQVVQTALGVIWLESDDEILRREIMIDHLSKMAQLSPKVAKGVLLLLGPRSGESVLRSYGAELVQWTYWWGIPCAQTLVAFFIVDTWQYFLHRAMHMNRFLYRNFHSVHHRLYVPYAFGALYNHPLEGFLLDTLGAAAAHSLTFMTVRQAIFLFTVSTIKTVDDHCGYRLWWDPCQMIFTNNADYHDIHHQAYGIKANFSQPFFTNWDWLLSTQMSRDQASLKTRRPLPKSDATLPARDLVSKLE